MRGGAEPSPPAASGPCQCENWGGARLSRSGGGSVRRAAYQQAWGPLDVDGLERRADAEEFARAVHGPASDDFPYLTARRSPWTAEAPRAGK
ncbi:hypothetical protein EASAB2608_00402 [Streptomyces sp. EAS-AB2608]|nr:hypothetical protein EASAB2608_00402 [Streptomyces sp. EAS-AB2608]